ncbi:MAG: efflux RND transporter permease subunit [Fimbriimonas sp.]
MGLTKMALQRPIFILMLMLVAFLIGGMSYVTMRKEANPEVNFGTVSVITPYPGAGPDDVNELISRKVEEAVASANGVRDIISTSQEGLSIVTVQLELGVNADTAMNDVRAKVDSIVNSLPRDALKPQVTKFDNASAPLLTLVFSSPERSSRDLRDLVDRQFRDRFAQIPGVAGANVQGGDVREIQVQVKKDKLLAYGLGIMDIQRAVAAGSVNAPSGRIVAGPQEYTVRVKNDYQTPEQIKNMIISVSDPTSFGGRPRSVRLEDVASVVDTVQERTTYSRLDGHDTITLAITKSKDGNAIEIQGVALGIVDQIQKQYKDIGIVKTFDQAEDITEQLDDVRFAIFFGVFLVSAIVYIFLHNLRGTIIVAIAIPTSIFASFIAMKLFGFTINNMSMLALSLAIGVLVDDAIVVLENIFRHLKTGEDPRTAALNGRNEIGLAALAITMADVVVFLPIAFMGGIVGQFFKPMALGFVFATLFSLFVSFTVTPLLASRWYKAGEDMEHPKGRFAVWFERNFGKFERVYGRALEWTLNHRWFVFISGNAVLLAVFAFIAGSSTAPKPPIGATGPDADPSKYGFPGAMFGMMPMGLFMFSLLIGVAIIAIHLGLTPKSPRKLTYRWGALGAAVFGTAALTTAKMAPMPPLVMVIGIFTVIYAVLSIIEKPSRLKYLGFAALFGLWFPVSAGVGYGYGQWKKEGVFKFQFFPELDGGQVTASIELPPGSSLAETERAVARIEKVFDADPDVKYILSSVGTQGFGGGGTSGSNYAQVVATLYDKGALLDRLPWKKHTERLRWTRDSNSVAADMTYKIGKVPGVVVKVSANSGFGFGPPVQLSFTSDDRAALVATVQKIRDGLAAGKIAGVINPDITSKPGKPELRVIPDRRALADQGVDASSVGLAVRTAYQGDDTTKLRVNAREYIVRVMLDPEDRNDVNVLNSIPLLFRQGHPIYLSEISRTDTAPGIDKITRRNRAEEIQVTADILPGYANGTVSAAIDKWIKDEHLVPESVHLRPLGQADASSREGLPMIIALFMGFILVYMVLASLYNNLLYPFIIQMAQPQAMVGALLALMLTDKAFNLVGFIGIVTLVGLVGKNAILLVDYTNTLRERGRNRHDAIVEAGPVRLRPIVMTTLALILGMTPVALAIGRGSEFRETIGIIIIGGISFSTVLTLFVIPASYTIFDDLLLWLTRKRRVQAKVEPTEPFDDETPTGWPDPAKA